MQEIYQRKRSYHYLSSSRKAFRGGRNWNIYVVFVEVSLIPKVLTNSISTRLLSSTRNN